ncbi:hypothetical protein TNCT_257271 [Trichonephila clavata]|uniref:Uncharacterized protein n=1 Tax=Trichonephila clavata TaxID=2740835 RepID=A0A8X6FX81_TRICU|nr:hypothetical protein TNCT_257271 [Trichonephila clavata]
MDISETVQPPESPNANSTPAKESSNALSSTSQGLNGIRKRFLSRSQSDMNHQEFADHSIERDLSGGQKEPSFYSLANEQWPPKLPESTEKANEVTAKEVGVVNDIPSVIDSGRKDSLNTSSIIEITKELLDELDSRVKEDSLSDIQPLKTPSRFEDPQTEEPTRPEDRNSRESIQFRRHSRQRTRFEDRRSRESFESEDQRSRERSEEWYSGESNLQDRYSGESNRLQDRNSSESNRLQDRYSGESTRLQNEYPSEPSRLNQHSKEETKSIDFSAFDSEIPPDEKNSVTSGDRISRDAYYSDIVGITDNSKKKWLIQMDSNQNYIRALINYDINFEPGKRKIEKDEHAAQTRWVIHYDNLNYIRSFLRPEVLEKTLKEESNQNMESDIEHKYKKLIVNT